MKKILLTLGLLAFGVGDVGATANLGAKKVTESISFPLLCLDSAGVDALPDSAHVLTYLDAGTSSQFTARSTTFPFSAISIYTVKVFNDTTWWFSDVISDIDGSPTPPTYTLAIDVILWTETPGIATHNRAVVQVIADSLNEFSKFTSTTDSVIVDVSSAVASLLPDVITDSVWDRLLTGATHNKATSAGLRLRGLTDAGLIQSGTSDNTPANTASTMSLESGGGSPTTSTIDGFYHGQRISIIGGTGSDQAPRIVISYTGSNQSAVIAPDWSTTPDATSEYIITPGIVHAETQEGGYEGGAVWISPNGSTTANIGVDGTINNPIDDGSLANARIVADALNLRLYHHLPGASITLDENYDTWEFIGAGYTVALGGQAISGSRFANCFVSGVGTGASRVLFRDCFIGNIETQIFTILNSGINGTMVMADAGSYRIDACFGGGPNGDAVISFGAAGNASMVVEHWNGKLVIDSMGESGTDTLQIDAMGDIVFNASNISGVAIVRGVIRVTDNSATLTSLDDALALTLPKIGQFASDSTLDKDTLDAFAITGGVGKFIKDSTTAANAVLAAGQFSKIGDSVWLRAFATVAGSYIDSMVLANELATKQELASETADSTLGHVDSTFGLTTFYDKIANMESGLIAFRGTISGATPSVSGFSDASLTEADDYWNDQMIMMVSGNAAGQAARTSDFTASTDSITVSPSFSVSPSQNDTFIIFGLVREAVAGGGGSDTTAIRAMMINNLDSMHRVIAAFTADSIWQADTANHDNVAGSFGASATLGNFATAGTVADSVWDKDTTDAFAVAAGVGQFLKDSTTGGGGGGSDTTAILALAENHPVAFGNLNGAWDVPDDSMKTLYVSDHGDNTTGASWKTAFTTINKLNAIKTQADSAFNHVVYIAGFRDSAILCSLYMPNMILVFDQGYVGIADMDISDTNLLIVNSDGRSNINILADNVRLFGNGATMIGDTVRDSAVQVDYSDKSVGGVWGNSKFPVVFRLDTSLAGLGADNDGADDVTIDGFNILTSHKPIVLFDRGGASGSQHDRTRISNNYFFHPKWHAVDGRGTDVMIYGNTVIGYNDGSQTPTAAFQPISGSKRWFIHDNAMIGGLKVVQIVGTADSVLAWDNYTLGMTVGLYTATGASTAVEFFSSSYNSREPLDRELLKNGSFELVKNGTNDSVYNWTLFTAFPSGTIQKQTSKFAHTGYSSIVMQSTAGDVNSGIQSDSIFLDSSITYILSGYVHGHTGSGSNPAGTDTLIIGFWDGSIQTAGLQTVIIPDGNSEWLPFATTAKPPLSKNFVFFAYAAGDEDIIYIDDLTLEWSRSSSSTSGGSDTGAIRIVLESRDDTVAQRTADSVWLSLLEARDGVAGSFGDSAQGWGATSSLAGSGLNAMVVGVTDTSGTDTLVSGVTVVMKDLAGNVIGKPQTTNSSGFTAWNVTSGDSVTVQIDARTQNNHIWPISLDTLIGVTDPDSFFVANGDSILMGYDFAFPANSTPNTSTVFGDLVDVSGSPDQYVKVYAQLSKSGLATDDSNTVSMIVDSTVTDTLGRWTMVLIWSSTVDSTKYDMWFENNGIASKKRQVFVEDGTLQRVTLGKK